MYYSGSCLFLQFFMRTEDPRFLAPYTKLLRSSGARAFDLRPAVEREFPRFPLSPEQARKIWAGFLARRGTISPKMYIHIPYCRSHCAYCKYKSGLLPAEGMGGYLKTLSDHAKFYAPVFSGTEFSSLYIGGGTPSLMSPRQIRSFFPALKRMYRFSRGSASSFELNLNDAGPAIFDALKETGFNRVSIGVQTLNARVLAGSNRGHYPVAPETAVREARRRGFRFINLDLILGLKNDTPSSAARSLEQCLASGASGVTLYKLHAQPGSHPGKGALGATRFGAIKLETRVLPKLRSLSESYGYRMRESMSCFEFIQAGGPSPAFAESLRRMFEEGRPVFGLGRYSISSIFGVIEYEDLHGPGPHSHLSLSGLLRPLTGEISKFMCKDFIRNGYSAGLDAFKSRFKISFASYFGKRLLNLRACGIGFTAGGAARIASHDPALAAAAVLYLLDKNGDILRAAAAGGRSPSWTLGAGTARPAKTRKAAQGE